MSKDPTPKNPVQVFKLKKHSWGVTMYLPDGQREVVDGFDSKRQAKGYAARAVDVMTLRMGQGF